jgi:hypothetical protein
LVCVVPDWMVIEMLAFDAAMLVILAAIAFEALRLRCADEKPALLPAQPRMRDN